ncbi:MAG TPA: hypothetical protein VNJ46_03100 [Gaiellaceae bacterium]|nr:hypothetical protein [Gaiellaceae bacterium]
MAAANPWRCSQCGTVNEPSANSCRACGRWPSLFELEDSELHGEEPATAAQAAVAEREPLFEVGELAAEVERELQGQVETAAEEAGEEARGRRRNLVSYLIPLAFVVYIVVSIVFGDR